MDYWGWGIYDWCTTMDYWGWEIYDWYTSVGVICAHIHARISFLIPILHVFKTI